MNSAPYPWIDVPGSVFAEAGVCAYGIVPVGDVADADASAYADWLSAGMHADMAYLERYAEVRRSPALLLEGAQSLISCAVSYYSDVRHPRIASYALGSDYHEVVRRRLESVAERVRDLAGGQTRVCVDTAPLRERYWAVRAGVGFTGVNGHLIVPGSGSFVFLGEILSTARLRPKIGEASGRKCCGCGRCVEACPVGALRGDGSVDSRRCLSYLTIEYRGEFPPEVSLHGRLYGCDICGLVCPHNAHPAPCVIKELLPRPAVMALTPGTVARMSQEEFSSIFSHSAMKRAKLQGLRRNALRLIDEGCDDILPCQ